MCSGNGRFSPISKIAAVGVKESRNSKEQVSSNAKQYPSGLHDALAGRRARDKGLVGAWRGEGAVYPFESSDFEPPRYLLRSRT